MIVSKSIDVAGAMRRLSGAFTFVGIFSGLINLLALTGALYMLQVYDRVLPSRSVQTLVGLTVLMVLLYAASGLLDLHRARIMGRLGLKFDRWLRAKVFHAVLELPLRLAPTRDGLLPVRDLDQIRGFLSGPGPTALFDMPWMPVYLCLVFLLHPLLGLMALAGAILLLAVTLITELRARWPLSASTQSGGARMVFGEAARRNSESICAMGMRAQVAQRWEALSERHLADQVAASDVASGMNVLSRLLRTLLQSGMIGLGAYLFVKGEVTAGAIVASSITMSRALAPIEVAIANWRGFVAARQSYRRLKMVLRSLVDEPAVIELPRPTQSLTVHGLAVAAPGGQQPILQNVSFTLQGGHALGIIGPSAAGKSTLARALVGAWRPMPRGGSIQLDGASLDQYSNAALGRDVGYLPQEVELFDGSVADNIARLDDAASSEAIIQAARLAGVHDMVLQLPGGYQARIGEGGSSLSAGQRQRVALARALYSDPFLVVLDEPNSNLDAAGDSALTNAINSVRARGGIAVVVTHRPSALQAVDLVLAVASGRVQAFGPKEEVLDRIVVSERSIQRPVTAMANSNITARNPQTPAKGAA